MLDEPCPKGVPFGHTIKPTHKTMSQILFDILNAPLNSPLILALSVAYLIVASIRAYDVRLIQAKEKGFYSGVAQRAEGRSPSKAPRERVRRL